MCLALMLVPGCVIMVTTHMAPGLPIGWIHSHTESIFPETKERKATRLPKVFSSLSSPGSLPCHLCHIFSLKTGDESRFKRWGNKLHHWMKGLAETSQRRECVLEWRSVRNIF